jgi:hypothetical protein
MIALSASQFANKMVKEMMSEAIEVEAISSMDCDNEYVVVRETSSNFRQPGGV